MFIQLFACRYLWCVLTRARAHTHTHTFNNIMYMCLCANACWLLDTRHVRNPRRKANSSWHSSQLHNLVSTCCTLWGNSWVLFQWSVSSKMKTFEGKNHEFWDARKHNLWIRRGLGNIPNHYKTDYWPFLAICNHYSTIRIPSMILWLRDWIISPCFKLHGMFIEAWQPCMFNRKILLAWRPPQIAAVSPMIQSSS